MTVIKRVFVRRTNNHQFSGATAEKRKQLGQRGDVITVLKDGESGGTVGETHPDFQIIEVSFADEEEAQDALRVFLEGTETERKKFRLSRSLMAGFVGTRRKANLAKGDPIQMTKAEVGQVFQRRGTGAGTESKVPLGIQLTKMRAKRIKEKEAAEAAKKKRVNEMLAAAAKAAGAGGK